MISPFHKGRLILDIPLMHMLFSHPQTCSMMDLAIVWDCHGRSEDAYGGQIATTVLIEGWLVGWTRRQFSITAG